MFRATALTAKPFQSRISAGSGALEFERHGKATVVRRIFARSPLRLLTPRNHGSAAWVYSSNFGGGLVGGDHMELDIHVAAGAQAALLTQSATKVYRSPLFSSQHLKARIESEGFLVVVPDPILCFSGSRHFQSQEYFLDSGASLVLTETLAAGRTARGERWLFDSYQSRIRVHRRNRLILHEALRLDPVPGPLAERQGRFNALAMMVLLGPAVQFEAESLATLISERLLPPRSDLLIVANALATEGVLIRLAGISCEEVTNTLRSMLAFLPARLGDDPWKRKW